MTNEHKPTHRRTLSGKLIPIDTPRHLSWHELLKPLHDREVAEREAKRKREEETR